MARRQRGVTITSHGGFAPERWWGTVDGQTFYFRERHDHRRMELDLRPSGRFYRTWTSEELDDDRDFEDRRGDHRRGPLRDDANRAARFIVGTVRDHLRQLDSDVRRHEVGDRELLCERRLNW